MEEAPFFAEVAEGPAEGRAFWLTCDDGIKVRMGWWPAAGQAGGAATGTAKGTAKGTVLLFPGRTEYVEKYGQAAAFFTARGLNMAALDWRGQGLAARPLDDPATGHVDEFADYQRDVAAMVAAVAALEGASLPRVLIGHSMGGCIGLRAAHRLPLAAVVFSAPMWGIRMHPALRPAAWALSALSRPLGFGARYAPGTEAETYVRAAAFEDNLLTRDPGMWAYMHRQLTTHPELALGGPSLHWLNRALVEMRALMRAPAPALPCLTFMGSNERIVSQPAIRRRMAGWPGGELVVCDGAEHEIMMERPEVREAFYTRCAAFFTEHMAAAAAA